ncbi:MAG: hypothetical protein AAF614_21265 [Chloroflexota bacterium]
MLANLEAKHGITLRQIEQNYIDRVSKCPECGEHMADLGLDFKAPKKKDVKAWQIIQGMYEIGHAFHTCGCNGFGYVPKNIRQYQDYLAKRLAEYNARLHAASRRFHTEPAAKEAAIDYWRLKISKVEQEISKANASTNRRAKYDY